MEKRVKVVFAAGLLCLVLVSFLNICTAQDEFSGLANDSLVQTVEQGGVKYEEFSAQENKSNYLSQEWTKILQKSPATSWIYGLNPMFKFLIGYEFSVSWAFVAALLVWIIILSIFFPICKAFVKQQFVALGIAIAITIIAAHGIMPKTMEMLGNLVKNIWWNFGTIFALIMLMIIINTLSAGILKELKKKREEAQLKSVVKKESKVEEKVEGLEAMKKGVEEIEQGARSMEEGFNEGGGI